MLKNKKLVYSIARYLLIILFLLNIYIFFQNLIGARLPSNKKIQTFNIDKGQNIDTIAKNLQQQGLINNSLVFKIVVKLKGLDKKIQAGSCLLSPSMSISTIADNLTQATNDDWITIPEGLRKEEVAEILDWRYIDKADFNEKASEGYLFPDTYLIPRDYTNAQVVKMIEDNFRKKISTLKIPSDLTLEQVIILASIVEREAKHDSDRAIVAGILFKRWREGWPLEVDATIQYDFGFNDAEDTWWTKNLTQEILDFDSPYNTRMHTGLPPTPICNPGLSSLKAVISPKESPYWFYISDEEGNMHYGKTLDEHNQNIAKYLDSSVAY